MSFSPDTALATAVVWMPGENATHPMRARIDGRDWVLRLGDFPAESLYTLLIDDEEIAAFDDWPSAWKRPLG